MTLPATAFFIVVGFYIIGLTVTAFAYRYTLAPMNHWKTSGMKLALVTTTSVIVIWALKSPDLKLMLSSNQAIALEIVLVAMIFPALALAWQLGTILQIHFWINLIFPNTYRPVIRLANEVIKSGSATVVIGQICCQAMKPIDEEAKS